MTARSTGGAAVSGDQTSAWPIVGHDGAVGVLRAALTRDRVAHAYLLAGPDGVGKTTLATVFAQALCCQSAERPDPSVPCGACLSCRKIVRGVHPDVQTVGLATQAATAERSGAKNNVLTIETVRQLRATAALRPMEARRRVLIVDDAETMPEIAQEALLKTLEEPPPAVVILLLADDAELLLATIRSRCQVIELHPVPTKLVADAVAAAGADPARAAEIAALAQGRIGWALRAVAEPGLLAARREGIERGLGWIEGSSYDRLVTAFRLGDAFFSRRVDVFADLETLLAVWRDALLLRSGVGDQVVFGGSTDRLTELAGGWELGAILRALRSVQTCIADLEANVRPRLALEAMVLQWPTQPRRP